MGMSSCIGNMSMKQESPVLRMGRLGVISMFFVFLRHDIEQEPLKTKNNSSLFRKALEWCLSKVLFFSKTKQWVTLSVIQCKEKKKGEWGKSFCVVFLNFSAELFVFAHWWEGAIGCKFLRFPFWFPVSTKAAAVWSEWLLLKAQYS